MRIHVTRRLPERALQALYATGWDIFVGPEEIPNRSRLLWGVGGAVGLLTLLTERIDGEVMDRCPELRCISNCAAGLDNVDLDEAARRGITVCNTPGVLTETCADFTWALILGVTRRLLEGDRMMRAGEYPGWGPLMLLGLDLHGATLGVLGMGQIGRAVARRASAFGMRVLPWVRGASLEEVLAGSDVVTVHLPLTAETRHLLNAERLARMKPGAYLVNTSRGPVLDEEALAACLASGQLAGAALDVFEREPLVHPDLVASDRVLLTPHIASATQATRERMAMLAVQNLIENL
ncbi:MAG: D-glycerate dehydrogenase [Candidatus Eremiobacteraeota bacterium]|nr:D-glycerate dehydrogenase [Candidatus Eremiobacteraeota bacterium]MCW5872779.1 D-glycerate dehydrogenase [Candidatus Eremiobacteraeota bacterium]